MTAATRARVAIVAIAGVLLLAGASRAFAAQLYAAPAGKGVACTAAQPCALSSALTKAASGDEVIIAPGTYGPSSVQLSSSAPNLNVHGVYGQPRPSIDSTHSPSGLALLGSGTQLSWVNVHDSAGDALHFRGQIADQVVAQAGAGHTGCVLEATVLIRNSVCQSQRGSAVLASAVSVGAGAITLRNVTASGFGAGGIGITAKSGSTSGHAIGVSVFNTIARGGTADVSVYSGGQSAKVTMNHSNWNPAHSSAHTGAKILNDGSVQTAQPVLDSPTGYHETFTSPTIDSGIFDPANGASDVDGEPRSIGAGTDIGADERTLAPAVVTGSASLITLSFAIVGGSVTANGLDTQYYYDYGKTSAYGQRTPVVDAGSGTTPQSVPVTLANLWPQTTFHFRLVATNAIGTSYGADNVLTTLPKPPPPSSPARVECVVPRLRGLTKKVAIRRIRRAHCRLGRIYYRYYRHRAAKVRLVVIAQSSPAGQHYGKGTPISFLLGHETHKRHRSRHR